MNQALVNVTWVMPAALATGLFVSSCTVQAPDGLTTTDGVPSGTYANVSGLVGIACMVAPVDIENPAPDEDRLPQQILAKDHMHVLLDDYYPTLLTGWRDGWRAVIDGVNYDIAMADQDSQSEMTRMVIRLITV